MMIKRGASDMASRVCMSGSFLSTGGRQRRGTVIAPDLTRHITFKQGNFGQNVAAPKNGGQRAVAKHVVNRAVKYGAVYNAVSVGLKQGKDIFRCDGDIQAAYDIGKTELITCVKSRRSFNDRGIKSIVCNHAQQRQVVGNPFEIDVQAIGEGRRVVISRKSDPQSGQIIWRGNCFGVKAVGFIENQVFSQVIGC